MSQVFTNKIKSARFINPPENSVIELLYSLEESAALTLFHLNVDFSDPTFLDFIKEWPLEKIEKEAAAAAQVAKDIANQTRKNWENSRNQFKSSKEVFNYINENNKDRTAVFDLKLSVLEHSMDLKDKKLKLRIRKAKTILDLLQIYNETVK